MALGLLLNVGIASGQSADPAPPPQPEDRCGHTGGQWDECLQSSCDVCDDCIAGCLCPADTVWNDDYIGCQSAPEVQTPADLCGTSGGAWNDCGSSSCEACDDCVGTCECPEGTAWTAELGCGAGEKPMPESACSMSGGTWNECAAASCDMCLDCIGACVCPAGMISDGGDGCIDAPPACEAGHLWDGEKCEPLDQSMGPEPETAKPVAGSPAGGAGCTVAVQNAGSTSWPLMLLTFAMLVAGATLRGRSAWLR